eukprot:12222778-Heterocapsa_arctica.AAC.1
MADELAARLSRAALRPPLSNDGDITPRPGASDGTGGAGPPPVAPTPAKPKPPALPGLKGKAPQGKAP